VLCLDAAAQRAASEAAGAQDLLARDQQELERRRLAHRAAQQEQQVRISGDTMLVDLSQGSAVQRCNGLMRLCSGYAS